MKRASTIALGLAAMILTLGLTAASSFAYDRDGYRGYGGYSSHDGYRGYGGYSSHDGYRGYSGYSGYGGYHHRDYDRDSYRYTPRYSYYSPGYTYYYPSYPSYGYYAPAYPTYTYCPPAYNCYYPRPVYRGWGFSFSFGR